MKYRVLAALALVALAGFYPMRAASRSASKIQVVYQGQSNGEWQVFIFGAEPCGAGQQTIVDTRKDASQPLEVECVNVKR